MIPAPPGIVVNFKEHNGPVIPKKVIAFDDDGQPMILGDRGLVRATTYANFDNVAYDSMPEVAALIPAVGWRVEYTDTDGTKSSQPLLGWGLCADGEIVPLDTDRDGWVEPLTRTGGNWRVYHPDATPTSEES